MLGTYFLYKYTTCVEVEWSDSTPTRKEWIDHFLLWHRGNMLTYSWPSRCYKPDCSLLIKATLPTWYLRSLVTEPVCSGTRSWWRHQIETLSALLAICAGNSPVTGEFTAHRPVTRSFDVFFDLRLNKRLSKQWWGWWFVTPSYPS